MIVSVCGCGCLGGKFSHPLVCDPASIVGTSIKPLHPPCTHKNTHAIHPPTSNRTHTHTPNTHTNTTTSQQGLPLPPSSAAGTKGAEVEEEEAMEIWPMVEDRYCYEALARFYDGGGGKGKGGQQVCNVCGCACGCIIPFIRRRKGDFTRRWRRCLTNTQTNKQTHTSSSSSSSSSAPRRHDRAAGGPAATWLGLGATRRRSGACARTWPCSRCWRCWRRRTHGGPSTPRLVRGGGFFFPLPRGVVWCGVCMDRSFHHPPTKTHTHHKPQP